MSTEDKKSPSTEAPRPGESFLSRFHRLKTEARQQGAAGEHHEDSLAATAENSAVAPPPATENEAALSDDDMPALESLEFKSDFSGFLSPQVSEGLRKAALRKLFHSAELNIVDGLDEYAEDFTYFEPLGDIVTSDMKHLIEVEARKQAEAFKEAMADDEPCDDEVETPNIERASEADDALEHDAVETENTTPKTVALTAEARGASQPAIPQGEKNRHVPE